MVNQNRPVHLGGLLKIAVLSYDLEKYYTHRIQCNTTVDSIDKKRT